MSTEILRRAAEALRSDAMPSAEFFDAVADWLDQESRVTCHADNPTRVRALAVARAYLGVSE